MILPRKKLHGPGHTLQFWLARVSLQCESMLVVETIIECSNVAFDFRFGIADANRVLCSWDEILFQIPFLANAANEFSH